MGARLYVGNLEPETTDEELRRAFERAGRSVESVTLVRDPITGRRRGFGFVELADEREAAAAAEALDGLKLRGRKISVGPTPRPHRPRFVGERDDGKRTE